MVNSGTTLTSFSLIFEPVREKTNNLGSDQARYKPGCTASEDGYRLEILDLESRGIVLLVSRGIVLSV